VARYGPADPPAAGLKGAAAFVFVKEADVTEQRQKIWRSPTEAALVFRLGALRGGGLGLLLSAPLAAVAWLFGDWLDRGRPNLTEGWMLAVIVLFVGAFVGMMIGGQRAAMSHWPHACRALMWAHWWRWTAVALALGLPVVAYVTWRCWLATRGWSLALGAGLEVAWLFLCFSLGLGCFLGERRVRQYLEEAGFDRVGWCNYAPRSSGAERPRTAITDAPAERTGVQEAKDGTQSTPD
jgi:hypothetical protein